VHYFPFPHLLVLLLLLLLLLRLLRRLLVYTLPAFQVLVVIGQFFPSCTSLYSSGFSHSSPHLQETLVSEGMYGYFSLSVNW